MCRKYGVNLTQPNPTRRRPRRRRRQGEGGIPAPPSTPHPLNYTRPLTHRAVSSKIDYSPLDAGEENRHKHGREARKAGQNQKKKAAGIEEKGGKAGTRRRKKKTHTSEEKKKQKQEKQTKRKGTRRGRTSSTPLRSPPRHHQNDDPAGTKKTKKKEALPTTTVRASGSSVVNTITSPHRTFERGADWQATHRPNPDPPSPHRPLALPRHRRARG